MHLFLFTAKSVSFSSLFDRFLEWALTQCLIFLSSQLSFNVTTHMEFIQKSRPSIAAKFETLGLSSLPIGHYPHACGLLSLYKFGARPLLFPSSQAKTAFT